MNFRDLEYLVAVARLSHFGRAAEQCNVSQSALSIQLQKLEGEMGVQLLERTSRSVVVTQIGKEVVRRAQELLQQKQEMIDTACNPDGSLPALARIGAIPTIAPYMLGEIQIAFRKSYPATTLNFDELVTERLTLAIVRGELDVGILATPVKDTLLGEIKLLEESFHLAVPARHSLSKNKTISPEQISADERLLLLKDSHCLREQVIGFCSNHRVPGIRQSVATSIETLLSFVRAGVGITLIPEMAIPSNGKLPGVRFLPVSPPPLRCIRVIFRKTSQTGQLLAKSIASSMDK